MMKKLLLSVTAFFYFCFAAHAQFESYRDSVVQLYGVVMSADSLAALPAVSISVEGRNQGTISNDQGVFSIVVLKGDHLKFTSVGYKPHVVAIPQKLEGNQQSMIVTMVQDTIYLPTAIIKKYPTPEEFSREFARVEFPDDQQEIARKNLSEANRRLLMNTYPLSGTEANQQFMQQNVRKYYSQGQMPPQNIFNPLAWAEFIKAWKRGDFKRNKSIFRKNHVFQKQKLHL